MPLDGSGDLGPVGLGEGLSCPRSASQVPGKSSWAPETCGRVGASSPTRFCPTLPGGDGRFYVKAMEESLLM